MSRQLIRQLSYYCYYFTATSRLTRHN